MKKAMALLMISVLLAGCTIPDPDEVFEEEVVSTEPDWVTVTGSFTYLHEDMNNTTYETVWLDTNVTYGFIECGEFTYNMTHLSFDIVNNTVRFNNYSYDVSGYYHQSIDNLSYTWNSGFAYGFGNVSLMFPSYPFDVTVDYSATYRVWNGRE
jgi:hypothetical protein|tara:strand:- start:1175 stop:1633 length:459 start_codon:yes stop_codon:yes gene_type:complete